MVNNGSSCLRMVNNGILMGFYRYLIASGILGFCSGFDRHLMEISPNILEYDQIRSFMAIFVGW